MALKMAMQGSTRVKIVGMLGLRWTHAAPKRKTSPHKKWANS